jgi:hypothetical protein
MSGSGVPRGQLMVPAANRYQGAWQEISARLQSRQFVQITFMTGVVVVFALGLVPPGGNLSEPEQWRLPVVLLLPLFTLAVALWVRHNNCIIGLLGAYCQFFERCDDENQNGDVPGWHDARYNMMRAVLNYRRYSDYALALIGFIATFPALYQTLRSLSLAAQTRPARLPDLAVAFAFGLGVVAIYMVLRGSAERQDILDNWVFGLHRTTQKHEWGRPSEITALPSAKNGPTCGTTPESSPRDCDRQQAVGPDQP